MGLKETNLLKIFFMLILTLSVSSARLIAQDTEETEEKMLPVSSVVNTVREISSTFSLIEEAVLVKTKAQKKTIVGITMQLESILSDTLAATGKSIRIYPESIYLVIVDKITNGEKDKKKISDALVLLQRTKKLVSKRKIPSIKLKLKEGKVIEVIEEANTK